jgi:hypothetical protein
MLPQNSLYNIVLSEVSRHPTLLQGVNLPVHIATDLFRLHLSLGNPPHDFLENVIIDIDKLDLSNVSNLETGHILDCPDELPKLRSLNLSNCLFENHISEITEQTSPLLQELILDVMYLGSAIMDEDFPTNLKTLSMQSVLEKVDEFPNNYQSSDENGLIRTRTLAIQSMPKSLENLNLSGYNCRSPSFLLSLVNLQSLCLSKCNLVSSDLADIHKILTKLTWLDISSNPLLTEDVFTNFTPISEGGMCLTSLNVSYTGIGGLPESLYALDHLVMYEISNTFDIPTWVKNFRGKKVWFDQDNHAFSDIMDFYGDLAVAVPFMATYVESASKFAKKWPEIKKVENLIEVMVTLFSKHMNSHVMCLAIFQSLFRLRNVDEIYPVLIQRGFMGLLLKFMSSRIRYENVTIANTLLYSMSTVIWQFSHNTAMRSDVFIYDGVNQIVACLYAVSNHPEISSNLAGAIANFISEEEINLSMNVVPLVKVIIKLIRNGDDLSDPMILSCANCLGNLTCYHPRAAILFVKLGGIGPLENILDQYINMSDTKNIGIVSSLLWNLSENDEIRWQLFESLHSMLIECYNRFMDDFSIFYPLSITLANLLLNEEVQNREPEIDAMITNMLISSFNKGKFDITAGINLVWGYFSPLWPLMRSKNFGIRNVGYFVYCHQTMFDTKIDELLMDDGPSLFKEMIQNAKNTKNRRLLEWCGIAYKNFMEHGFTRTQLELHRITMNTIQ